MHDNRFNDYRIPSSMLVVFLEKALTLILMDRNLHKSKVRERSGVVTSRRESVWDCERVRT